MIKLITFDMDGTLLSPEQKITDKTRDAIRRATASGIKVALCTGRSVSELKDYVNLIPEVRYSVCVSGALLWDFYEGKELFSRSLEPETVLEVLKISDPEDPMIQFLKEELILERAQCEHAEYYHIEKYKELFRRSAKLVEDIRAFYREARFPVGKLNLYHKDPESRERDRKLLLSSGLPIVIKDSELTSLEISDVKVNKGEGLKKLCAHLGITTDEAMSVGDAANDLDVLNTAGLPVAVGNAWPEIKEAVLKRGGRIVADNAHDGCAEAVELALEENRPGRNINIRQTDSTLI